MKTKVYSNDGKAKEESLADIFNYPIREDICKKVFETEKIQQPFAPYEFAGKEASASGKIKRARKVWKTGYGHGMSRVPRKALWRRGNQFHWRAAVVASVIGGRRAHPPKVAHFLNEKSINKKERILAIRSGIASTASEKYIKKRYASIENISAPFVIHSEVLKLKTKDFFKVLVEIFQNNSSKIFKEKIKRAGQGRDGKRETAGLLMVIGKNEKFKASGIDIVKANELAIADLWPLGRLTLYTTEAVKELAGENSR